MNNIKFQWKKDKYIIRFGKKDDYAKFFGFIKTEEDKNPDKFILIYDLKDFLYDHEPFAAEIFDFTYGWDVKDLAKLDAQILKTCIYVYLPEPYAKL